MFKKSDKVKEQNVDIKRLNDVIGLSKGVLHVLYIILIVVGIYAGTKLLQEWKLLSFLFELLTIVAPLFIGLFIAWLFDPIVSWLQSKKIPRVIGCILVYLIFFVGIGLLIYLMHW